MPNRITIKNGDLVYFRDPVTNESFLLNPNRTRLGADKAGLAKAAAVSMGTWYDASGMVEITIYEASAHSGYDNIRQCDIASVAVQVDPDRVLVGGGAETTAPGTFLTKTYPSDAQLTTWSGQSKDHGPLVPHDLFVYAVGLRLRKTDGTWIPAATLKSMMEWKTVTLSGANTYASAQNNNQYSTIGGGVNIQWSTMGQLITENRPNDVIPGWKSATKSHKSVENCPVTTYAIGIQKAAIPGFGTLKLYNNGTNNFQKSFGTAGSGERIDNLVSVAGYAPTCMGSLSGSDNGAGRLIERMGYRYNNTNEVLVFTKTKDQFVASSGTTYTYLVGLAKL